LAHKECWNLFKYISKAFVDNRQENNKNRASDQKEWQFYFWGASREADLAY